MTKQSSKISTEKSVKKTHYPASKWTASQLTAARATRQQQSKNEKFGLVQMLQEICLAEEESINSAFAAQSDIPNPQIITNVLTSILRQLPQKVQALGGNNMDFEPELRKQDKSKIISKQQKLHKLQALSDHLRELEENPEALREETNLWLGRIPEETSSEIANSSHVTKTAEEFQAHLGSMNSSCDRILAFVQDCKATAKRSQVLHDKLYDNFNQVIAMWYLSIRLHYFTLVCLFVCVAISCAR